jgi:UPF0271 protein
MPAIDISSEMAEGFALPPGGVPVEVLSTLTLPETGGGFHPRHAIDRFDDDVMPVISSVHLACGLHSGDAVIIQRMLPRLTERGIQLGAHPSYPDVFRFGQVRIDLSHDELVAVLLYQFGALQGVLAGFGERVRHVKCHGALAFDVAYEEWACNAMADAIRAFDPELVLVLMAGAPGAEWARARGLRVIEEGFIDRGYGPDGRLAPRDHPKALHETPDAAVAQLLEFVRDGAVTAVDGTKVPLHARTFCLHSDTPAAAGIAQAVRAAVEREGLTVRPLGELA